MAVLPSFGRDPDGAQKAMDDARGHMGDQAAQGAIVGDARYYARNFGPGQVQQGMQSGNLRGREAGGAGGHQDGAIGLAGTMALGRGPSVGAMQLQRGLNQASDQQQALARSARGGAAIATAGANAQANTAALQQNAWSQAGALRAQEMAAGRNMYGTGLGQQQDQNGQRIGQGNDLQQFNSGQRDSTTLGMNGAAVGLGNVGIGTDKINKGYYDIGMQPVNALNDSQQAGQVQKGAEEKRRVAELNA